MPGLTRMTTGLSAVPAGTAITASCTVLYFALPSAATTSSTGARGPHKPVVRNIMLENVTSTNSPRVMWVVGFPGVTIENVRFKDCTFRGLEAAEVLNYAASVSFENVQFEPARRGRSTNSPQAAPPSQ